MSGWLEWREGVRVVSWSGEKGMGVVSERGERRGWAQIVRVTGGRVWVAGQSIDKGNGSG